MGGWGARKDRRLNYSELTAKTKYGGTVRNVKRKRVPGGGSSYSKTTRIEEKHVQVTVNNALD